MTNEELQTAFRLYYNNIYNLCYNCLGHIENAEDITISAFMEVCDRRESLNLDKVEGFLVVVAKSKIVDFQRRGKIWHKIIQHLPIVDHCIIHDKIDSDYQQSKLLKALEQLPPKMKMVLKLTYIEGYNRNEVAKITSTSPNTVRNNIVAGLSKLKQLVPCDE